MSIEYKLEKDKPAIELDLHRDAAGDPTVSILGVEVAYFNSLGRFVVRSLSEYAAKTLADAGIEIVKQRIGISIPIGRKEEDDD